MRDENYLSVTWDLGNILGQFVTAPWQLSKLLKFFELHNIHGSIGMNRLDQLLELVDNLPTQFCTLLKPLNESKRESEHDE